MPTLSETVESLVAAAAAGDRGAQQRLLNEYWPVIRQAVRGRKTRLHPKLAAREQTQDLQQQVAIKLLANLGKHEWQGQSAFTAWVRKLADMEVLDTYKRHAADKRAAAAETQITEPDGNKAGRGAGPSPETEADQKARLDSLLGQIEQLKSEYATALLMYHMGFSHAEIGETLACSSEAARKLVSRGRVALLKSRKQ